MKSAELSSTQAQKHFGFQNMSKCLNLKKNQSQQWSKVLRIQVDGGCDEGPMHKEVQGVFFGLKSI